VEFLFDFYELCNMNARKQILDYINNRKFMKALQALNNLAKNDNSVDLFVGKIVLEGLIDPSINLKDVIYDGMQKYPEDFFDELSRFLFIIYKGEEEEVGEILLRMLNALVNEIPYAQNQIEFNKSKLLAKLGRYDEALEIINHLIELEPYYAQYLEHRNYLIQQKGTMNAEKHRVLEAIA